MDLVEILIQPECRRPHAAAFVDVYKSEEEAAALASVFLEVELGLARWGALAGKSSGVVP